MYVECSPLAMPIYVNLGFAKVISVWTTKHSFFFFVIIHSVKLLHSEDMIGHTSLCTEKWEGLVVREIMCMTFRWKGDYHACELPALAHT